MAHRLVRGTITVALALGMAGCGTVVNSAIDAAARNTGAGIGTGIGTAIGQRAGEVAGAAVAARLPKGPSLPVYTPDLSAFYVSYLFAVAFHSGSYAIATAPYEPGEWTRWRVGEGEESGEMERAFLLRTPEGNEWWRVRFKTIADDGTPAEFVLEGLFNKDRSQLLRLRGKMPEDKEPKEMPVMEGTYGYVEPTRLTPESVEGATVGVVSVKVPAGTFEARHVRFAGLGGGTLEWWVVDSVPGGLVRYTVVDQDEEGEYAVELAAFGKGATSVLGSF